jgi:HK97 family phage prohead protease
MPDLPEQREYQVVMAVRAETTGRHPYRWLEGRAVPYDTWADIGWFLESHRAGSFKRSTNGRSGVKLPLLLMHDNRSLGGTIGHAESWRNDDDGLYGVWRLADTPPAQEAAARADAEDLVGLSVGFQDAAAPEWEFPRDFDPDGGPDAKARVTRVESRLLEVSLTPTPAFATAGVSLVRTRARRPPPPERAADRWWAEVERLKSGVQ